MICRVCKNKSVKIYSTDPIPECIWPTKIKSRSSKCHVFSCVMCSHLQLQNFSKQKISKFYGDVQSNLNKSSTQKNRLSLIKDHYGSDFLKRKKILDVGGGINPILQGKNIYLVDFKIQKKMRYLFKKNFFEIDIEKNSVNDQFDIIFLTHTLEHFKYPKKAISNIMKSLKINGRLFIEIPNFDFYTKKNTYYAIFHQHLSMFTYLHLSNFLKLCGLSIDKLFLKTDVIFCSVKKTEIIKKKLLYIDNKKIFKRLNKNYNKMKKKISNYINNRTFNIYGAGGSMVLSLASLRNIIKNIVLVFDNDTSKQHMLFPGTNMKIYKNIKKSKLLNKYSLSTYKLKKNNNLNIHLI